MKPIGSPVAVATRMRMRRYLNIELKLRLGAVLPNVRLLINPEDGFFYETVLTCLSWGNGIGKGGKRSSNKNFVSVIPLIKVMYLGFLL